LGRPPRPKGGRPMVQSIREIMTSNPVALPATTSIQEAARCMKDREIGDVIVLEGGTVCEVVTDRDIVVRAVAENADPAATPLNQICSRNVATLTPSDSVEDAVRLMRQHAIRRIPIVENGSPVGVVSLGDLALERDPESALADISAAPGNA
jgi:CBS domain-containing protein